MMLKLIGVNHKTAPIALREKIAIGRDELPEATRRSGRHAGCGRVHDCLHL